jgi:hypothetical protein
MRGAKQMAVIKTGKVAHDAALLSAEQTRQQSIVPGASQATCKAADLAYARAALASCIANNNGSGAAQFSAMLRELGVNS